jgi:hypothetical protein
MIPSSNICLLSHLAFNMPLAKLYTNSLLSTLNERGGGMQYGVSTTTGIFTFNDTHSALFT